METSVHGRESEAEEKPNRHRQSTIILPDTPDFLNLSIQTIQLAV